MSKYFEVLCNIEKTNPFYEIWLNWDSNDADYISKTVTFPKEVFEKDETLQLILSFLGHGYSGKLFDKQTESQYGHHITNTKINGLIEFIIVNDLEVRDHCCKLCHSIHDICVTYFDEYRTAYDVRLVDFDTLYSTGEEAIKDIEDKIKEWWLRENEKESNNR